MDTGRREESGMQASRWETPVAETQCRTNEPGRQVVGLHHVKRDEQHETDSVSSL